MTTGSEQQTQIFLYGGGEIAQALLAVLKRERGGDGVHVCDQDPDKATCSPDDVDTALAESDVVFVCVPSFALPEALDQIARHRLEQPVVTLTKGLTPDDHALPAELLRGKLGSRYGVLAGPMLAEELVAGEPSRAVCAGDDVGRVMELFADSSLAVEVSDDAVGASLCGVMKNIYSIGLGIAAELGLGANTQGALITRGLKEMQAVLTDMGADPATVLSPAGAGDLIATGTSEYSSNFSYGRELVRKRQEYESAEGKRSIEGFAARYPTFREHRFLAVMHRILVDSEDHGAIRDAI